MSFNYDLNKQDQEVVFSRKLNKSSHPKIFFSNAPVVCVSWQKHLGIKTLTWYALITVYKSLVRPQLDYGDIIDDQPSNESLNQKIERIQCNAALAVTGMYVCNIYL